MNMEGSMRALGLVMVVSLALVQGCASQSKLEEKAPDFDRDEGIFGAEGRAREEPLHRSGAAVKAGCTKGAD